MFNVTDGWVSASSYVHWRQGPTHLQHQDSQVIMCTMERGLSLGCQRHPISAQEHLLQDRGTCSGMSRVVWRAMAWSWAMAAWPCGDISYLFYSTWRPHTGPWKRGRTSLMLPVNTCVHTWKAAKAESWVGFLFRDMLERACPIFALLRAGHDIALWYVAGRRHRRGCGGVTTAIGWNRNATRMIKKSLDGGHVGYHCCKR